MFILKFSLGTRKNGFYIYSCASCHLDYDCILAPHDTEAVHEAARLAWGHDVSRLSGFWPRIIITDLHPLQPSVHNPIAATGMSSRKPALAGSLFHSSNVMISGGTFIQNNSAAKSMHFFFTARSNRTKKMNLFRRWVWPPYRVCGTECIAWLGARRRSAQMLSWHPRRHHLDNNRLDSWIRGSQPRQIIYLARWRCGIRQVCYWEKCMWTMQKGRNVTGELLFRFERPNAQPHPLFPCHNCISIMLH